MARKTGDPNIRNHDSGVMFTQDVDSRDGTMSGDGEVVDDAPKSKRRRTAVACAACRIRKSRCNGRRPTCAMCENLALECIYESCDTSSSVIVRKDYVSGVEGRLRELEEKISKHEQLFKNIDQRFRRIDGVNSPEDQPVAIPVDLSVDERHVRFENNGQVEAQAAAIQELTPEDAATDGMAISFLDDEDSGYFGQSSNISFMRHITRAMALAGGSEELTSPARCDDYARLDSQIVSLSRPASPDPMSANAQKQMKSVSRVSLNSLPSEAVTRELVKHYFSNTGRLFPYIHEPTFMETYDQMIAANFTTVRRTWLGLLNMVLAMASNASDRDHHDQSAQSRIANSDVFYQRALGLCETQIFRGTSLETGEFLPHQLPASKLTTVVQYLLLMSQYLQGTQKSVQTWAIHGLAVKAAYSIGLHSSTASRTLSPIEREMRKRTWFGCVILDRTLCMTFGRPLAIPEDHIRLPLPMILEEDRPTDEINGTKVGDLTASVLFYNATITLYRITAGVISSLYAGNLGCDPPMNTNDMITKVFRLEQEIDEWIRILPNCLRLVTQSNLLLDGSEPTLLTKFRVVLSLRCLNLQVLLYRPILVRSIDQGAHESQLQILRSMDQMQANHIQSCLSAAKEIISIVHAITTSGSQGRHFLGAWWFSLYYVFNSTLMIFGSLLATPKHLVSTSMIRQIEESGLMVTKAIQALQHLDRGNVTVYRCINYLEQISRIIESRRQALSEFLEDPTNTSTIPSFPNLRPSTADNAQVNGGAFATSQDALGYVEGQDMFSHTNEFGFSDGAYGGELELELSQFFMRGGGMNGWNSVQ